MTDVDSGGAPLAPKFPPEASSLGHLTHPHARIPLDIRARIAGRDVRFTNVFDDEAVRFERELLVQPIAPCHERAPGAGGLTSESGLAEPPVHQRIAWLRHLDREARLFQMRAPDGRPAMQVAVVVQRVRWMPTLAHGVAPRMGHATSGEEEMLGLRALRALCAARGDLVSLRLQARRLGVHALCDFEQRARRAGFTLVEPEAVTRTLLLDLRASSDELMASLSSKTRRKIRARAASPFEIRVLEGGEHLEGLRAAALASVRRTGGMASLAPWAPLFGLAPEDATRARVLGLFDPRRPDVLLAFVAGVRHGALAEYLSAGSVDDPLLRAHPFNYFLLWELAEWARSGGARHLDLGGVTDGGPDDELAGISAFKRHFSDLEAEIGREMFIALRPNAWLVTEAVRRAADRVRGAS